MKKIFLSGLIFLTAVLIASCFKKNVTAEKIWETSPDLLVAESVMYDQTTKNLYVSCINGKPTEKNNNGYISRVSLEGKILEKQWITGINAPKGMGILRGKLFVTDIDRVHQIDIEKGKITKKYSVPEAKFLNDIAIDSSGNVYVSDMITSKIYRISDGKISEWLTLKEPRANGLFMDKNRLLIGTGEGIVAIDVTMKIPQLLVPHDGNIDGLKPYSPGVYIISDWKGKTEIIGGIKTLLLNTTRKKINAADFEYIPEKKLLLVPTFFNNRITAYRLK